MEKTAWVISKIPKDILEILKSFSGKVAQLFPCSSVILFGSYAKGSFNADSDIDIAVFLPESYKSFDLVLVFRKLCRLSQNYEYDIQPQVFFKDEFDNPAGIVEEIVEYGLNISALDV